MRTTHSFARILSTTTAPALCLGVALLVFGAPVNAQTLTNITLFRTDGNGNTIGEGYNTRGNETSISNVYLLSGVTPVNSGNGAAASIAINLSAPGVDTVIVRRAKGNATGIQSAQADFASLLPADLPAGT